ncbi:MAG TPA: NUDIX hydrolase [Polyangiales bacterium]|nr:NUDIX hydrolase [Polyangiales bacterium]
MKELCDSVAKPCARSTYTPGHFTASAFVLSPERDALLLILHGKLGLWLQPGGHVDDEDVSLLEAARREVCEEVGLRELQLLEPVPLDVDIHDIPAREGEPAHQHFDVRFLFRAPTRAVQAGSDAKDARWVSLAELGNDGLVRSDESVLRAVRKLRA